MVFTVSVGAHSWVCVEGGSINCRSMYGLGEVLNAGTRTVVANDLPHIWPQSKLILMTEPEYG